MKIKLYIITYKQPIDLNNNLDSLFKSNYNDHELSFFIINNHTQFELSENFVNKVHVMHNVCRPDFSTGHLSRNWNQALINGFKNLNSPDCDIVITCQDDTLFEPDWLFRVLELHDKFNFIQMGIGDNFCSYLPQAIKNIGLWDERFCGLGFQEADYFLRALIYNKEFTCLNDYRHGRLINQIEDKFCYRPAPADIFSDEHIKSFNYHPISEKIFNLKWPTTVPNHWSEEMYNSPPLSSSIPNFITYPYFEKDICDLINKNYII